MIGLRLEPGLLYISIVRLTEGGVSADVVGVGRRVLDGLP